MARLVGILVWLVEGRLVQKMQQPQKPARWEPRDLLRPPDAVQRPLKRQVLEKPQRPLKPAKPVPSVLPEPVAPVCGSHILLSV